MEHNIKIMAFDLDGTLLKSDKTLDPDTLKALEAAAEKGVEIVPCTGRFYKAMPQVILELPFIHYAININGAAVYDVRNQKSIAGFTMPYERVLELMAWFEHYDCIYDAYFDNWGYMSKRFIDNLEGYVDNPFYQTQIRSFRIEVPDIRTYIEEKKPRIQKCQVFKEDDSFIKFTLKQTKRLFPDLEISSSEKNDIEYTNKSANKGNALKILCEYLGIDLKNSMGFGDGGNDVELLKIAGIGVAMENAKPMVKDVADFITRSNNDGGIAYAIEKFVL